MVNKSIYAGSSMGLKFNVAKRGNFEEYRLDVLVYFKPNEVVLAASTDTDVLFPVSISKVDLYNAVLVIPASATTSMPNSIATIEERYTHKSSGYRQVFKTKVEVRSAIIGYRENTIPELSNDQYVIDISRNIGFNISAYDAAVAGGFIGTEEEWLQSMQSTGTQLPSILLTIKNRLLFIKIECAPANFEDVLSGFNVGLMRYHKVNKSKKFRKGSIAHNSGSRFSITDDRGSMYAPGAGVLGLDMKPYLGTHLIPWTANKIEPIPLTKEMVNVWTELPYSARYIFERFAYFAESDSSLASIEQIWNLPHAHACLQVPGKNLKLVAPNGGGFRYTMRFGLCLFKRQEVVVSGRKQIEIIRNTPVYFRVGIVAVGGNIPKPPAFVFKHIGNNMNWKLG